MHELKHLLYKIHLSDGICFMQDLPDNCIDLIITDPPYNSKTIGPNKRKYSKGLMQLPPDKYITFCKQWFNEAIRISKKLIFTPGIANTHNYPQPTWQICWHKPAAVSFNRMGGFNAWEPIFVYYDNAKGLKFGQDFIIENTLNCKKGLESLHPRPKPIGLYNKIFDNIKLNNLIVFDPFIGSGTSALSCIRFKHKWFGCDINSDYCDISYIRIKNELAQSSFSLM